MRPVFAEAFGTFCLVFAGTGAIVANDTSGGSVTHLGVALTFGLAVACMIGALADVSGAHLNPAVTLGAWRSGLFPFHRVGLYWTAQLVGAVVASLALRAMFPEHPTLGATLPRGSAAQSWAMEFLLTLILMFVILSLSGRGGDRTASAAGIIGGVVTLEALFAGPISGASMNPARSIGPAVISGAFDSLWVYITAPAAGAVAGVALCCYTHGRVVCCKPEREVNLWAE